MQTPERVLEFWLDEIGPKGWYGGGEALDRQVRDEFHDTWQVAADGGLGLWLTYPTGTLAYIIVTDQLPRNMFRRDRRAFSTDHLARAAAKKGIKLDWDLRIDEPARQFFYMPLMHAENLCDQDRAARLICARMPETGQNNLPHARAHREIIRRYGRFPHRNDDLGRATTRAEAVYLDAGGYGTVFRELQAAA